MKKFLIYAFLLSFLNQLVAYVNLSKYWVSTHEMLGGYMA